MADLDGQSRTSATGWYNVTSSPFNSSPNGVRSGHTHVIFLLELELGEHFHDCVTICNMAFDSKG